MTSPTAYSPWQVRLHWLAAILIVLQVVLHEPIAEAWKALGEGGTAAFHPAIAGHVAGGILVFLFALWRIGLRARRGAPPAPAGTPAPVRFAAGLVHAGLYGLMLLMPLSGAAAWFGGVGAAAGVHGVLVPALIGLVALHVVASLWHQFWLRDGLIVRMLRPAR
ncbi:MAG: cytochrome b/b6 domain-containing protein [Rhodobacteraceae bacterium]|jgi:cytochrome b561|nr:cytochrome b/b6 domain-containing protein [Paracoccaceae bacterium]